MRMCHLLPERIQCDIQQRSTDWVINQDQNMKKMYSSDHAIISFSFCFISLHLHVLYWLIHCWHTLDRWWLKTNDTSIWIVTNIYLVVIFFQLHHARSVEHTDCFGCGGNIFWVCPIFCNYNYFCWQYHESYFFYYIEMVGKHGKLAIRYSSILTPSSAINYLFCSLPFHL